MLTLEQKKRIRLLLRIKKDPSLTLFQVIEEVQKLAKDITQKEIKKIATELKEEVRLEIERMKDKPITDILKSVKKIKGEKGDTGKEGYTPIKGKDYFDGKDGEEGIAKDGRDGIDGKDGIGKEGKKGEKGEKGDSIPGRDGKDGSPDKPEEIRDKLQSLKGDDRLDASAIKNLPMEFGAKRGKIHRGGITLIWGELLGTGDGSTTTFELENVPYDTSKVAIYVGVGRLWLTEDFTISGKTITFITAPPNTYKVRADYQKK